MEQNGFGLSCAFYTVKQLAALFGKSEDAIRRWKNEGLGKDEDNIKLRAVEREDGRGRKNARHLVFSRDAVIEFVKANPFLMDDAPQLSMMMQAEGAWSDGAIPMPGEVGGFSSAAEEEEWDREVNDAFASRFSRGNGAVSVRPREENDRRPVIERRANARRSIPFDDFDDDFEDESLNCAERLRRRFREESDPEKRETGFMAQARRVMAQFEEEEREDEEAFEDWHEEKDAGGYAPPRYGSRHARRVTPRGFAFDRDEYGEEDEPDFQTTDTEEPFSEWEDGGWHRPMPRGGRETKKAADEELQRRIKIVNFALEVLRERAAEFEKQRAELDEALGGLESSGMDEKTAASISRVLLQKKDELAQQKEMLEEFVDVIEEDIKD